ncbi:ribonuclease P protein subunit p38 [Eucyclogobius newberryi]|uniref:ribonuclease P protein subunit p38 n=1 Tax=Eucyclogobius newberryi TaxID=166745 RepID=UPI003B59B952
MNTPKKPTKKEAKKFTQSKAYFTSPFSTQWSSLPQEDMNFILSTIKDKMVSSGFQKKEDRVFRPWRKKKGAEPETPKVTSEGEKEAPTNGWTDVSARRQLAIGINEVTRALERNELQLLLVCKSVKPQHMTEHLIALSASRAVPACQVPRLSATVCESLGLKSVLALGFRRPQEGQTLLFTDVIEAITPRVPAQGVAWLQSAASTERPLDTEATQGDGEKRGLKRKLEESDTEPAPQNVCTLQPLKVKKIVANPDKKRKVKKKGLKKGKV